MNPIDLGRKIKEARLNRKMTQSEVVGDFITRNMLSQIESGTASPSMKTLQYLSDILDIPLSQLVDDNNDNSIPNSNEPAEYLLGKKHYLNHDYILAIDTLEPILIESNSMYDETSALLAKAYYAHAMELDSASSDKCLSYVKKAISLSANGIFASDEVRTASLMLLNKLL